MASQVKESKQASHWMKWDRVVKVSCKGNCSYQKPCILNAYIKDEKIVHMEQSDTHPYNNDPDFPDWNPRGCQKGLVSGLSRTYGEHRILHPLKRAGERGSGKFEQVSWRPTPSVYYASVISACSGLPWRFPERACKWSPWPWGGWSSSGRTLHSWLG